MRYSAYAMVVAALASGCAGDDGPSVPRDGGMEDPTRVHWTIPAQLNRDVDLLFVIDNSGSMAGEQASLAANFASMLGVLQRIEGGLPNLHIGIVSSNVGAAGQASVPGCAGQGDDGNLQVKAGCTGLTGQFISDVANAQGDRVKNYTGNLESLFSCMATLGTGGCGFEMHLESLYRALQPGKNPNFYRPGAMLAVVILADEDDCSTEMGAMFGDPTAGLASALGPRTSFRCHEFGVVCDDDPTPRAFGTKTGCRPRPDSQYMFEIDKYEQFLKGLKTDARQLVVTGIFGIDDEVHTVVVGPDPMTPSNPTVEKSCFISDPNDPNDGATPPIRLSALLRRFPRNVRESVCRPSFTEPVVAVSEAIRDAIGNPCVRAPLRDTDLATTCLSDGTGCEFECVVKDVVAPGTPQETVTQLPACPGGSPCWQLVFDPRCQSDDLEVPSLALEVTRNVPLPAGSYTDVSCTRP